ncbi:unnamed protein product [Allacma fusca]|uniref:Calmodulin-binding domain-containing protein n=1 Tax=Allacma fusca TaxID=39272 RepID=A0A8J2M8Q9_9HEXA|nr:unnamed protein product [Allacma fusca]
MDTQLTKRLKNSAANVLRETWLIYKHTKLVKRVNPSRVRAHQRKFLLAIYALRKVKMDQRKLMDNSSTITDMAKTQNTVYEIVSDLTARQDHFEERLQAIEEKIALVHEQLEGLPDVISRCLSRHSYEMQSKNYLLRPESAATPSTLPPALPTTSATQMHNNMPHSKSVPTSTLSTKTLLPPPLPPRTQQT